MILDEKNILKQAMHFVDYCLKHNFYRNNKSALCFRLDPKYLNYVPYNRREKFPRSSPMEFSLCKGCILLDFIFDLRIFQGEDYARYSLNDTSKWSLKEITSF